MVLILLCAHDTFVIFIFYSREGDGMEQIPLQDYRNDLVTSRELVWRRWMYEGVDADSNFGDRDDN